MNDEIKEFNEEIYVEMLENGELYDYITNLQHYYNDNVNKYEDYKSRCEKAIEYGNNCLEMLKDQNNYVCESIDIVELLKMIHKNYIDILNGRSDE